MSFLCGSKFHNHLQNANVYVYVWFIDSSHTVLTPGQVIADFVVI